MCCSITLLSEQLATGSKRAEEQEEQTAKLEAQLQAAHELLVSPTLPLRHLLLTRLDRSLGVA